MKSKTLQEAALDLPPNERADLARRLLLSLDDPSEEELAQIWLLEAEQRAGEIDRGEVEPISAEEGSGFAPVTCRFHPAAKAEHLETVAWYESRRVGLGARYLAEFERVLKQVCGDPYRTRSTAVTTFAEPGCGDSRLRFSIGRLEVTSKSWRWRITGGGRRTGSSGSSLRPYKMVDCPEQRPRRSRTRGSPVLLGAALCEDG